MTWLPPAAHCQLGTNVYWYVSDFIRVESHPYFVFFLMRKCTIYDLIIQVPCVKGTWVLINGLFTVFELLTSSQLSVVISLKQVFCTYHNVMVSGEGSDEHFVEPDLDPNCLIAKNSANDRSRHLAGKELTKRYIVGMYPLKVSSSKIKCNCIWYLTVPHKIKFENSMKNLTC